jgi:uncharacterized delta-60 repeat protein
MLLGSKETPMIWLLTKLLCSGSKRTPCKTAAGAVPCVPLGVEQLEERLLMNGGYLDPTFGPSHNGTVFTHFNGHNEIAYGSTFQADGKIIVVGSADSNVTLDREVALARYTANGALDPTFGVGGMVLTDFPLKAAEARAVAVQNDGKIVVAGSVGAGLENQFLVMRYNSNGSLDSSFGNAGIVTTKLWDGNNQDARLGSLALQSDGKIVVAGMGGDYFGLARYNTDGSLDTSFGPNHNGTIQTQVGTWVSAAYAVAIESDGKIVAAGQATPDSGFAFAVVRYNHDGSVDTSFGPYHDGTVLTNFDIGVDTAFSLVLTSTKILAVGEASVPQGQQKFAAVRYNLDGSLDTSFGPNHDGKATVDFGDDSCANSVVMQSNGEIVLAGSTGAPGSGEFALARLYGNGSLDTTIGSAGLITTSLTSGDDGITHVLLQADGKIVADGYAGPKDNGDFGLARYDLNQKQWPMINPNLMFKPGLQSIDPPPPTLFVGPEVQFLASSVHAPTAGATVLHGMDAAMVSPGASLAGLGATSAVHQKLSFQAQDGMTLDFGGLYAAFAAHAWGSWELS